MSKGLYRDVISIIQDYLMPSKQECDENKRKIIKRLVVLGDMNKPSYLEIENKPFKNACDILRVEIEKYDDECRLPKIKDVINDIDYLSRHRISYLYKKCMMMMRLTN